jgi:LPS-assembly lipoprotein
MQRRVVLTGLAALPVTACGFKLRGGETYGFSSMFLSSATVPPGPTALQVLRALSNGGQLQLILDPQQISRAQVALEVLGEQREKVVVGVSSAGQVREFQLRSRLRFRVRTPQGKELIADSEIAQQRDISYNESAALSKEAEEARLYQDMQNDIVQQLLRRLAALKL